MQSVPATGGAAVGGVLVVHSCPPALTPHVEWVVARELDTAVRLGWTDQPAGPGLLRSEGTWRGAVGTAGRIASGLRRWRLVRFEVTEAASPGCDAERYAHTPDLGLHRATAAANGDVLVGEHQLRVLLEECHGAATPLQHGLERLLGGPWDAELEPYRLAGQGAPVTRLHKVG